MKKRRYYRPTSGRLFFALIILSAAAMFLPAAWGRGFTLTAVRFFQPLAAVSRNTLLAAHRRIDPSLGPAMTDQQVRQLQQDLLAWRNRAVYLAAQARQREQTIRELTGIRKELPVTEATLLTARITQWSSAPWRKTMIADRGRDDGVRRGDPVISRLFVTKGEADGVQDGMDVLAKNYLIGRVLTVHRYYSLVQLFNDVESRVEAVIRPGGASGNSAPAPVRCILEGTPRGSMICRNVPIKHGIRRDDPVFAAIRRSPLPHYLLLGHVTEVSVTEQPTVVTLTVAPQIEVDRLDTVYIVNPVRGAPRAKP